MLIGIRGKAHVGKDVVGKMICELLHNYQIKKFAGALKDYVGYHYNIPRDDFEIPQVKETFRQSLIDVGKALRSVDPDWWVDELFNDYDPEYNKWVITDLRFKNENERIKEYGGITILVVRNTSIKIDDISEHDLDTVPYDYLLDNNGTFEETKQQVIKILQQIKLL